MDEVAAAGEPGTTAEGVETSCQQRCSAPERRAAGAAGAGALQGFRFQQRHRQQLQGVATGLAARSVQDSADDAGAHTSLAGGRCAAVRMGTAEAVDLSEEAVTAFWHRSGQHFL